MSRSRRRVLGVSRSRRGQGDKGRLWQRDTQGECPRCPQCVSPALGTLQGPAAAPRECPGRAGRNRSGWGGSEPRAPQIPIRKKKKKSLNSTPGSPGWGIIGIPKATLILLECRGGSSPSAVYIRAASGSQKPGAFPTWKNGAGVALGEEHSPKVSSAFVLLQLAGREGNGESLKSPPLPVSFPGFRNVK